MASSIEVTGSNLLFYTTSLQAIKIAISEQEMFLGCHGFESTNSGFFTFIRTMFFENNRIVLECVTIKVSCSLNVLIDARQSVNFLISTFNDWAIGAKDTYTLCTPPEKNPYLLHNKTLQG
jgi:hypothetical protein